MQTFEYITHVAYGLRDTAAAAVAAFIVAQLKCVYIPEKPNRTI